MASVHRDDADQLGFEDEMFCLPSHVLDQACDHSKVNMKNRHQRQKQQGYHREPQSQYSKSIRWGRSSSYQRWKHATGGPGMQAVFLVSGEGSCGTGVFLPQKAGTKSTRKPACAPVLLPTRVVQALNLKVQQLGLQISPSQGPKYRPRRGEGEVVYMSSESARKKNDEKDGMKQCSQSSSAEIFLPKEWTY